jgi:hypothetical protein
MICGFVRPFSIIPVTVDLISVATSQSQSMKSISQPCGHRRSFSTSLSDGCAWIGPLATNSMVAASTKAITPILFTGHLLCASHRKPAARP